MVPGKMQKKSRPVGLVRRNTAGFTGHLRPWQRVCCIRVRGVATAPEMKPGVTITVRFPRGPSILCS